MLETGDDGVVEVMTRCSAVHNTVTLDSPALGLCLNAAGPDTIHIGEVWLILPTKRNSRLLTLHERPRAAKRAGAVLLPGRCCWLCRTLYLRCREGYVGAFWLVILLGQVVGAANSFDALSSGGDHMVVIVGFVLLDTAVGVVMGRCLVI